MSGKVLAKEPAPEPRASGSAGEGQDGSFRQPDSKNGGDALMEVESRSVKSWVNGGRTSRSQRQRAPAGSAKQKLAKRKWWLGCLPSMTA